MSYNRVDKLEAITGSRRIASSMDQIATRRLGKNDGGAQAVTGTKQSAQETPAATVDAHDLTGSLIQTRIRFLVDHDSHRIRIQVLNSSNDEIIREIPPEELARIAEYLQSCNQPSVDERG